VSILSSDDFLALRARSADTRVDHGEDNVARISQRSGSDLLDRSSNSTPSSCTLRFLLDDGDVDDAEAAVFEGGVTGTVSCADMPADLGGDVAATVSSVDLGADLSGGVAGAASCADVVADLAAIFGGGVAGGTCSSDDLGAGDDSD